jgi:hypothetical protein
MNFVTEASLWVGGALLVVAALGVWMRLTEIRARRTVRRTRPMPIASWRPGRGPVAGQGFTDYGPAGPQTGPLTGADCAWYRFTLQRVTSRAGVDGESRTELLMELESPAWPAFADETGRAALDPSMLDIEGQSDPRITDTRTVTYRTSKPVPLPSSLVLASVVRDLDSEQWLTLTEVRVRQGRVAYALGRVYGPAVALAPNRRGYSVCTTDNRDQVIANRDEAAEVNRFGAKVLLILGLLIIAAGKAVSYLSR